ncbi:MAG: toxin-antitoxin system YwqK family antitoxin [Mucilaginibacter sp.]
MKKLLLLLVLTLPACFAEAQVYRTFLDENGHSTDSAKAKTYIIFRQLADTAWLMQHYDKNGNIMEAGTFKDRALQIPHGKFVFYHKFAPKNLKNKSFARAGLDTMNHLKTYGVYKDGLKEGYWVDYFPNGHKAVVNYYEHGKLNGPSETYNYDTNTVLARGSYENDQREGHWTLLNPHGVVIQTDVYHLGKVVSSKESMPAYEPPKPMPEFYTYMDKGVHNMINDPADLPQSGIRVVVTVDVSDSGKLSNPKLVGKGYSKSFDKNLLELLGKSPLWVPANTGEEKKPIKDFSILSVEVYNGLVTVKTLDQSKARFYNITH